MRLISKRHDLHIVFPVHRKRYVFTSCTHPNHSEFFGGNFRWKLLVEQSTLTPAGASANWHETAEAEGRTCIFEETVRNFLLGLLLHSGILSIYHNILSLSASLIRPSGGFPDLQLSRIEEYTIFLVVLKCMHWVCLYQNTAPLMRSIKKCRTVLVQILVPSRWLFLIVHLLFRYVSWMALIRVMYW